MQKVWGELVEAHLTKRASCLQQSIWTKPKNP